MRRSTFIDIAKGIGIILVVLGHLDTNGQISREMIYSFHMPLFFLLSGIFASTNMDFKLYLKKSLKTLYLPYFIFIAADTILFTGIRLITHQSVFDFIRSNTMALIGFDFMAKNRPLWFLLALFIIRMVYYFINKNRIVKYLSGFLCVCFVFLCSGDIVAPLSNCVFFMAIPGLAFYILGNILGAHILHMEERLDKNIRNPLESYFVSVLCVIGLFVLLLFSAHANGNIDMTYYRYGNAALYLINAVIGSFMVLLLALLLSKIRGISKLLAFYGQNSIIALVCHYYICRIVLPDVMGFLSLSDYLYHPVTQSVVLLAVMLIMIPVIIIVNKYFYFMFGKKKQK